jgi:peroxiredoxin
MLRRSRITAGLALCLALSAVWLASGLFHPQAPEVEFRSLTGKRLALADWRGEPVLATFWASDCRTCLKEIPALIELHRRYAPRGLRLVAIAMAYDMPSHVVSLAQKLALPYEVALDPLGETARAFGGIEATPTTWLIGPDGRIRRHIVGDFNPAELAESIESLL